MGRAGLAAASGDTILQAQKVLHVSPFFPVEGEYRLRVKVKDNAKISVLMRYSMNGAAKLTATLRGVAERLTTRTLIRTVLATGQFPLRPLVSIHVEALRLWLKRVPFFRRPKPPQPWSRARDLTGR